MTRKPVSYGKGAKAAATKLHSLIVRAHGKCEKCGAACQCDNFPHHRTTCVLTCSHILPRSYANTRALPANGQCLCLKCADHFTKNPVEFARWVFETIGEEKYDELRALAISGKKVDWQAVLADLKEQAKGLDL